MTDTPPFDPPYITSYDTADGVRHVETLPDGTTRVAAPISTNDLQARSKKPNMAVAKGRPKKNPPANKPAPNPNLMPGDRRAMLFLVVPFAEKDDAKRLGARWDAAMRKWYVPHGVDVNVFRRWWPEVMKQEAKALQTV